MIPFFSRRRRERELDEEIRSHFRMAVEERVARGEAPEEAERAARREFGNEILVREVTRMMWGGMWLDTLARDLRHAAQSLRRSPGFTTAVVLSLALGIGATTTVFAFADPILLRPLPYPDSDRLVALHHEAPGVQVWEAEQSDGTYLHYRARSHALEEIGTYYENVVSLSGSDGSEPERVPVAMVSSTFFDVLGARALLGRLPSEEVPQLGARNGDPYVRGAVDGGQQVILSHDLWRRRYGSDPDIVGKVIEANRAPRTVMAVLEPGFAFPRRDIGLWYPEDPDPATARAVDMYKYGIGRLAPGVTPEAAERELDGLIASLPEEYPDLTPELLQRTGLRAVVTPLKDEIVGEASLALWLLSAGMAFLLLIACANVASLILVRAEHRDRDVALRSAIGAGRRDIVRLFTAESLILALLGGGVGLLAVALSVKVLVALVPPGALPRIDEVAVDGRVVALAAALTLGLAVLLAVAPGVRGGRELSGLLKEGARGTVATKRKQRGRRILVAGQLSLSLSLLIGAALMVRTAQHLRSADLGFDPAGLLTAEIAMPRRGYETYDLARDFWDRLTSGIEALPGVESVGLVTGLPLVPREAYYDLAIDVEDRPGEPFAGVSVFFASTSYFATMRERIVEGRAFEGGVDAEGQVVISGAAARKLFPEGPAIGRRIRRAAGPGPWMTVAGVLGDVPASNVGGAPAIVVYMPIVDQPTDRGRIPSQATIVVRTEGPPAALAPGVRAVVRSLDPDLPLASVRTMDDIVAGATARTTFTMLLLLVAAVAALFLGVVGVYGVTAYTVGGRTQEIGLRVALGATRSDVQRLVLAETAGLVLAGVVMGGLSALALTRFMASLLFEVQPTDLVSYIATIALLVVAAFFASWIPARRASSLDPRTALSVE